MYTASTKIKVNREEDRWTSCTQLVPSVHSNKTRSTLPRAAAAIISPFIFRSSSRYCWLQRTPSKHFYRSTCLHHQCCKWYIHFHFFVSNLQPPPFIFYFLLFIFFFLCVAILHLQSHLSLFLNIDESVCRKSDSGALCQSVFFMMCKL